MRTSLCCVSTFFLAASHIHLVGLDLRLFRSRSRSRSLVVCGRGRSRSRGSTVQDIYTKAYFYCANVEFDVFDWKDGPIQKEFEARGILEQYKSVLEKVKTAKITITALKTILVAHETKRFEKEVETELNSLVLNLFFPSLRIGAKLGLLRQLIEDSEDNEKDWSAYEIDIKKYCKKQSDEYTAISLLSE